MSIIMCHNPFHFLTSIKYRGCVRRHSKSAVSMGYTRVEVTEKGLRFSRDSDKDARRFQCQSQSNMDKMKLYWNVKNFKIKSTEINGQ